MNKFYFVIQPTALEEQSIAGNYYNPLYNKRIYNLRAKRVSAG